MKKFLFISLLSFWTLFAIQPGQQDYSVSVKNRKDDFVIDVVTKKEQSSMGTLIISELNILIPTFSEPGVLSLDLMLNPSDVYLPALGPREGYFVFPKGNALPAIAPGEYRLFLDNVAYGSIVVEEKKVFFYPIESLDRE